MKIDILWDITYSYVDGQILTEVRMGFRWVVRIYTYAHIRMLISIKKPPKSKNKQASLSILCNEKVHTLYAYTHVVTSFHILQCKYVNKNNHIKQSHVLHYTTLYSLFRKDRRILRST